jgi:hypothetical protein
MNPADSDVATAEKARRKDKKQKRKKHNITTEDDSGATTTEEGAPHKKKKKKQKQQRKDGGEVEEKTKMLKPTVSIAVAGSIIDNAQSLELATLVCATPYYGAPEITIRSSKAYNDISPVSAGWPDCPCCNRLSH